MYAKVVNSRLRNELRPEVFEILALLNTMQLGSYEYVELKTKTWYFKIEIETKIKVFEIADMLTINQNNTPDFQSMSFEDSFFTQKEKLIFSKIWITHFYKAYFIID